VITTAAELATLGERLETGWQRINAAELAGADAAALERFWLTLLDLYERLCDELRLREAILAAVTAEPTHFDRVTYESLIHEFCMRHTEAMP
jgi:AcrR family transcriptional regulator